MASVPLPALTTALPTPRTSLVGRAAEVAAARVSLLDDAVPLLTLTGPGGVGKTRLALAIAKDVEPAFTDGAVFIDLSPIRDAALVLPTIAQVLGVREAGASPYGVMDMAGNVWEWTADWYDAGYYSKSPGEDPKGPSTGTLRVMRGGCWVSGASSLRTTCRKAELPDSWAPNVGFRCVYGGAS